MISQNEFHNDEIIKMDYENMDYNLLCYRLEMEGWDKETTFINEKFKFTSLYSAQPGETTLIIDIKCPEDQKILIRGIENGDIENYREAYPIKLVLKELALKDNSKKDISPLTKIRITKEKLTENISVRCFYADISRNDEDHLYRPRKNILLQEGEHLYTFVIGEDFGLKLPDLAINNISFQIKVDIFKFN